jgi:hypothetical protein
MSKKLKFALAAQLLTLTLVVRPAAGLVSDCFDPPGEEGERYCEECNITYHPANPDFWTWDITGYECEMFSFGVWVQGYYDDGFASSSEEADTECDEAETSCSLWAFNAPR